MNLSDDGGLIIEGSRNIGDDAIEPDDTTRESADFFDRTMQKHGIAIDVDDVDATDKNLDDFSRELLDQGGIEIVSSEESAEHYGN